MVGEKAGQGAPGRDADQRDRRGGEVEHRSPTEVFGDEAADHSREQDAQQQTGHHSADDLSSLRLGGKGGRGGHDVLGEGGGQSHGHAGKQQHRQRGRERTGQQRRDQQRGFDQDDAAPIVPIAERDEEQDSQRIAQLGQRGNPADRAAAGADRARKDAEHGLAVVQRSDGQSGTRGQKKHQTR